MYMNWATTGRSGILLFSFLLITFLFAAPAAEVRASDHAVKLASKGKFQQAFSRAKDPLARKTVEWLYLRSKSGSSGYNRIMAFVQRNGRHYAFVAGRA